MNYDGRNPDSKEVKDVWIRAFPLPVLNATILDSLAKSDLTTNLQQISIAKLILGELVTAQDFNKECRSKNFEDLCDDNEPKKYLQLFDALFTKIVTNDQYKSDAKTGLIDLVRRHCDEGTIDFDGSTVKAALVKTTTNAEIKQLVIDALVSKDGSHLTTLVKTCSPSVPKIFHRAMAELWKIFQRSKFHPDVMSFSRKFIKAAREQYKEGFIEMYPTYLRTVFIIHEVAKPFLVTENLLSWKQRENVDSAMLELFNDVFNEEQVARACECFYDEGLVSFYIASTCDQFLEVIRDNYEAGKISFQRYPHLWLYMRSNRYCGLEQSDGVTS